MPPLLGSSQRLLNRDHAATYFDGMPRATAAAAATATAPTATTATAGAPAPGPQLRRHGDEVQRLGGGYYRALGRCDDTMNLGGIKVASVELERAVLERLRGRVREAAAVGVPAAGGGPERLHLFVVAAAPDAEAAAPRGELLAACQAAVRGALSPLFKVEAVEVVAALPRTASNKVMRRVLRDGAVAAAKAKAAAAAAANGAAANGAAAAQ